MIVDFEVVKVEMKCSLAIKNGFCCSYCCAESSPLIFLNM